MARSEANDQTEKAMAPAASVLTVESTLANAGSTISINVRVTPQGNETQYGFALNFDPALLSFTGTSGTGTTGATSASCNLTATPGQIFCAISGFPGNLAGTNPAFGEISPTPNQILISPSFVLTANLAAGSVIPASITEASASNDAAQPQVVTANSGTVTVNSSTPVAAVAVLDVDEETAGSGSSVTVDVRVSPVGNETQFGFALDYDQTLLTYTGVTPGNTGAAQSLCNLTATPGRIFCSVGGFTENLAGTNSGVGEISPTANQILIKPIFTLSATTVQGTIIPILITSPEASNEASDRITLIGLPGSVRAVAPNVKSRKRARFF
jgi:hypothetical protein